MNKPTQDRTQEAQAANTLAMSLMREGRADEAAIAFAEAASLDPRALPLWRNLAHAHRTAGNILGERAALERALELDRLDFGSQLRMAQLHQRTGNETEALKSWSNVRQLVAQLPGLSPSVMEEVQAGLAYCDSLSARMQGAVENLVAKRQAQWDQCEERRLSAFVDLALGRRQTYHNECAGLYYPFLPADEYFDRSHFPWLDELESHVDNVRAELEGILREPADVVRPYVQLEAGGPENKWSALDGSLDWTACFLWEYGTPNLPVIERCPKTAEVLARLPLLQIPGRGPSAFFSIMRPRSHIPPHTGVTNTRAIIHLALEIPENCRFRVGGETREWVAGKAFAFDDTIEHEAWNNSDQRRSVLIVDAWNPHLTIGEREAIVEYFELADHMLSSGGGV